MSFLDPILLSFLPLAAIPIVIHLINQRRYQTIRWGAMQLLLVASRTSRGHAKLRQWAILACRMLVIAGLLVAISRPLAGGWLGLAAGTREDTTLVLLDRSPSMQQRNRDTPETKLETGRRMMADALALLGSSRPVLIDSVGTAPMELVSPAALMSAPRATPAGASADLPAMLELAHGYMTANRSGSTGIWICSDLRAYDWHADDARWQALREAFAAFPQRVRFRLLGFPEPAPGNIAVRVTNVELRQTSQRAELLVSLELLRDAAGARAASVKVPVEIEIEGARSVLEVEMSGARHELVDHPILLDRKQTSGWGRVALPADDNAADNEYFFVFAEQPAARTIVVVEDRDSARPFELAASIAPDGEREHAAEVWDSERLEQDDWDEIALVLWQGPLPAGETAARLTAFVERGGQVIFFPPRVPSDGGATCFGVRWSDWVAPEEDVKVASWRSDQDLLARTAAGAALPVGRLRVSRYCSMTGDTTPLAVLEGDVPLLARAPSISGGVYFCGTTPSPGDSSLAMDGVVFYVMVQRALAAGDAVLGSTRQLVAGGTRTASPVSWRAVATSGTPLSSEYPFHSGVYEAGHRWLAVNRAAEEDRSACLGDDRVRDVFRSLDFARLDATSGDFRSLIQEIWRVVLGAMIVAMLVEAALCLPRRRATGTAPP